jgi:hypothetical protein
MGKASNMDSKATDFEILRWLFVVSLVYVLSVGPAMRLCVGRAYWDYPNSVAGIVWRPILSLDKTRAHRLYEAYMRLWGVEVYGPYSCIY